jgi:hypothetical protein
VLRCRAVTLPSILQPLTCGFGSPPRLKSCVSRSIPQSLTFAFRFKWSLRSVALPLGHAASILQSLTFRFRSE